MRFVLLSLALVAGALPLAAGAANDTSVDALLARSRTALGGDAIQRLHSMHVVSDIAVLGVKGKQEQWIDMADGTFAEFQDAGPASGADGFDGHEPWTRDAAGVVQVQGGVQARLQAIDQAYLNGYALWLPDHGGATVESAGEKTVDGVAYEVLRVTPRGGSPLTVFFDQRGLPRRTVAVFGPQTYTTTLDDFRSVDGALVPYHVRSESDSGNASDAHAMSIEANPATIAAHLIRPVTSVHDFSIEGGATTTSVPFDLVDNHVYLNVMLNGKGPYRFIFDSGGANVVDPAVLKELGLSAEGNLQGSGVGSTTEGFQFAKIATLQIGQAKLTDQNFAVAPVRRGFGIAASAPADGLIGYEVLSRFLTTNDYQNRRIILRLPGASTASLGTAVPFEFNGNTPMIEGSIDGVPGELQVDTGSRVSISIYKPFAQAHPGVVPPALSAPGVNGFGVGGAEIGRLGRIAKLQIGPYTMPNLIGDFSEQEKGAFADPYTAANVGGGVWKRFAVTFDYPNQTMYLAPNAAFSAPDEFDRSGLFMINRDGKPTVLSVRQGTPAALAGLTKGDVITSINGRSTAAMSLLEVRTALAAPAGTRVQLSVTSGTGTKTVNLTLKDYA
jgi:hypothetical protein